jgi:hypothetical protein
MPESARHVGSREVSDATLVQSTAIEAAQLYSGPTRARESGVQGMDRNDASRENDNNRGGGLERKIGSQQRFRETTKCMVPARSMN